MRAWLFGIAVALAGCGNSELDGIDNPPDAGCGLSLSITPDQPVAGPTTRVIVSASGAPAGARYTWRVTRDAVAVTFSAPAGVSAATIEFVADTPGSYTVEATPDTGCSSVRTVTVLAPSGDTRFVRLRAIAPLATPAAPLDVVVAVPGADASAPPYDLGDLVLETGVPVNAMVRGPLGGVAGYVRFSPNGMPDAVVEAFADGAGAVAAALSTQPHTVLVVPSSPALAPRRFTAWSPAAPTPLAVDAGTPVRGTLLDAQGAGLAGATVQLTIDGVPSTIATTTADGAYTVGVTATGAATLSVTPPADRGLWRLTATGALADGATVRYAAATVRSLAGVDVRAHGAPLASTEIAIVGTQPHAGSAGGLDATGELRLRARTSATGALPALAVPAALLWIVAADGSALASLDLRAGVPATVGLVESVAWTAVVRGPDGLPLAGAVVDLAPTGPLALAGAPAIQLRADAAGVLHGATPPGVHYDLRLRDPLGRAAPLVVLDRDPATLASHTLSAARTTSGRLRVRNAGPLAGGAVQLMCMACEGAERARPIAEALTDAAGAFTLAVPLTGTR